MSSLRNPKTGKTHRLVTRAEWRARPPKAVNRLRATVDGTFEHWTVTAPASSIEAGSAIMREIQRYHQDVKGWLDFAYNFGFDDAGNIYEGRGWGIANGATLGYGSTSHAFVYIGGALKPGGNGARHQPTQAALDALFALEATEDVLYGPGRPRRPHSSVDSTGCPGIVIVDFVTNRLPALLAGPSTPPAPTPAPGPTPECKYRHQGTRSLKVTSPAMRGADVSEWQFLLNVNNGPDRAHWVAVDGVFGYETETETRRFQRVYSTLFAPIAVDGIVGPGTRAALCTVLNVKGLW